MEIDKVINKIEDALKKEEDYENFRVGYIMYNKESNKMYAYANEYDEAVYVNANTFNMNFIQDWAYSIDNDIFDDLERGYEIVYMTPEFHSWIWNYLDDIGIEDINHKKGMQQYLDYCEENDITKRFLYEKLDTHIPDIMKYNKEVLKSIIDKEKSNEKQDIERGK